MNDGRGVVMTLKDTVTGYHRRAAALDSQRARTKAHTIAAGTNFVFADDDNVDKDAESADIWPSEGSIYIIRKGVIATVSSPSWTSIRGLPHLDT